MVINDKVDKLAELIHDLVLFLAESTRSKSHYEELRSLVDRAEDLWLEQDEPDDDIVPVVLHFTTVTEEQEPTMEVEEDG